MNNFVLQVSDEVCAYETRTTEYDVIHLLIPPYPFANWQENFDFHTSTHAPLKTIVPYGFGKETILLPYV